MQIRMMTPNVTTLFTSTKNDIIRENKGVSMGAFVFRGRVPSSDGLRIKEVAHHLKFPGMKREQPLKDFSFSG